ncbi:hypothetical protein RJT34_02749 [Clitoria ternatea]|uniref:DNA-directed RNA polymerase n=1 Tax=Clitoria ternatea TaxID=43366 RepID=A0AAN9KKX0_CLITE
MCLYTGSSLFEMKVSSFLGLHLLSSCLEMYSVDESTVFIEGGSHNPVPHLLHWRAPKILSQASKDPVNRGFLMDDFKLYVGLSVVYLSGRSSSSVQQFGTYSQDDVDALQAIAEEPEIVDLATASDIPAGLSDSKGSDSIVSKLVQEIKPWVGSLDEFTRLTAITWIFDALYKLSADSAANVQSAAHLLDRLVKVLYERIPYLDEWSTMVEEYSVFINEAVQALLNASVQIPVGGNVRGHGGKVVDRVVLSSDKNKNTCIKFLICHTRKPELCDKFSSKHGQNDGCGIIVQHEDFPFSKKGICPNLIVNPHGFPRSLSVDEMHFDSQRCPPWS